MRAPSLANPWVLYVVMLLSAPLVGLALATATSQPPGACSGIGWGCSLYGWDLVGFVLIVVGLPFALVLMGAIALLELLRLRPLATGVAALGVVAPWLLVVVLAAQ